MLFSHPIPGLSPPEGEGTRAAVGKGYIMKKQPIKIDFLGIISSLVKNFSEKSC